ncbi:hypothetical protein Q7499_11410, partial [Glaesserella parasuis]|nr:hypothetical protein [Glaesserella parasuis]
VEQRGLSWWHYGRSALLFVKGRYAVNPLTKTATHPSFHQDNAPPCRSENANSYRVIQPILTPNEFSVLTTPNTLVRS